MVRSSYHADKQAEAAFAASPGEAV